MPSSAPLTRKTHTEAQRRAADLLIRYLKPAHELIHGTCSWLPSDDDAVMRIVEDLVDVEALSKQVARHISARVQGRRHP